jgi:hypothetical protein
MPLTRRKRQYDEESDDAYAETFKQMARNLLRFETAFTVLHITRPSTCLYILFTFFWLGRTLN